VMMPIAHKVAPIDLDQFDRRQGDISAAGDGHASLASVSMRL